MSSSRNEWSDALGGVDFMGASEPVGPAAEVRAFLIDRLSAALDSHDVRERATTALDERTRAHRERARRETERVLDELRSGRPLARWVVRTALLAHREHADSRPEWHSAASP